MNEKFNKAFEYEQLKLRIEFVLLNEKYIAHRIYKDEKQKPFKALD